MTIEKIFTPQDDAFYAVITHAAGPQGALPLTPQMLMESPSGNLFGMTQNAGMGWDANKLTGKEVLIIGTQGGIRAGDGRQSRWATTPGIGRSACRCRRREGDHPQWRDPVRGLRQRSVRRALAGHARYVRFPAVPQRRGDRVSPPDPLPADAAGGDRRSDLR